MKLIIGNKKDSLKTRWHLLPWWELAMVAKVMEFGVSKYGEDNWKYVKDGEKRYLNAALRHSISLCQKESNDPETNLSHYSHAICSLLFSHWHHNKGDKHVGHRVRTEKRSNRTSSLQKSKQQRSRSKNEAWDGQ